MTGRIGDPDAMTFAARFYSHVAEGQSVESAWMGARAQMELDGFADSDLPVLESRPSVNPAEVRLVIP